MTWLTHLVVVAAAATVWGVLVPRLRIDDPQAPNLAELASARSTAWVGVAAGVLGIVLWLVPAAHHWLWGPYLVAGLPLVAVDLRTTFLPKRLNALAAALIVAGLIPLAVAQWQAAVGAVIGATAAFLFFYLAWRLSPTLGFGDVRLALLTGAVSGQAGASAWTTALLAGTVLGAVHGVAHALWARGDAARPRHFAFGPTLWLGPCVAAVAAATAG